MASEDSKGTGGGGSPTQEDVYQELFEKANAVASARIDAFLAGAGGRRASLPISESSPEPIKSSSTFSRDQEQNQDFQSSKSSGRRATVAQINTNGPSVPRYLANTKSSASKAVSVEKVSGKESKSSAASSRPSSAAGSRPPRPSVGGGTSKTYFALKPAKPVPGAKSPRRPSTPSTPTSPTSRSFQGKSIFSAPSSPTSNRKFAQTKVTKTFSNVPASPTRKISTESKTFKTVSQPTSPVNKNTKLSVFSTESSSPSSTFVKTSTTTSNTTAPVRKTSVSDSVPSYLSPTSSSSRKSYSREKVLTSKNLLEPDEDSPPQVRRNFSELRASFEQSSKPSKPVLWKSKPQESSKGQSQANSQARKSYTREKVVTSKSLLGPSSPPTKKDSKDFFEVSVSDNTTPQKEITEVITPKAKKNLESALTNGNSSYSATTTTTTSQAFDHEPSSPTLLNAFTEIQSSPSADPSGAEAFKSYTSPTGAYTRGSFTTQETYEPRSTNGTTEYTEIKSSSTSDPIDLDSFRTYSSPLDSYSRITTSSNLYDPSSLSTFTEIKTSGPEPDSDSSAGSARRSYTRDKLRSISGKTTQAESIPAQPPASRRELLTSRYKTTTTTSEPLAIPRITVTRDTEESLPPFSAKGTNFARRSILESSAPAPTESKPEPKRQFSLSDDLEAEFKASQQESLQFEDYGEDEFAHYGTDSGYTPGLDSYEYLQSSTYPEGQVGTVASSEESFPADPKEGNRLFSSRVKSSQNWVKSFPGRSGNSDVFPVRSGNSDVYYSDNSSSVTPEIFEDRGHEYSYVTTETRKIRPKDKKILSYETTEKVPILIASSPEVEESYEKISIETPRLNVALPEVSAHRFGSPPRQLLENLSKSSFEFTASDAPIFTPPIERHRQAVVDKWLENKTRGGTRTYRSSWAVGNRGAETSSKGGSTLAQFERLPPEPILYQPQPRVKSSYHTKSIHTESIPGPFYANTKHSSSNFFDRNDVDFSDPENFVASAVYRSSKRDENLQPLKVHYGEFSDEDNTSPRSFQPSEEDFVPVKVEVIRKGKTRGLQQQQPVTKNVKKTVKTVTTTRSGGGRSQHPDNYFEIEDVNNDNEIEDLNGTVEYVDSREFRNQSPMRRSTQQSEVVRQKVSVPGGGYQIRETRSTSGRGGSPSRSGGGGGSFMGQQQRQGRGRSPTRRADTMDGYGGRSRSRDDVVYYNTEPLPPKGKKFLKKVQHELDSQRDQWKDEVERMTDSFALKNKISTRELQADPNGADAGNSSFVDNSSGSPVFKAFVDVSEYPASGLDVSVDNVEHKVVVKASKRGADGITRSFTQKVQLPRYADENRVVTKLSREGVLRVEVPLMFYFQPEKKRSKSFINQVVTKPDGSKYIEVLVNVGHDTHAWNLRVLVNEKDELLIMADKNVEYQDGEVKKVSKLIKRYILPKNAIVGGIKSKLGRDGRLMVTIPLADTMSD